MAKVWILKATLPVMQSPGVMTKHLELWLPWLKVHMNLKIARAIGRSGSGTVIASTLGSGCHPAINGATMKASNWSWD